ncbi:acetyl-CoA carboxylase biotin carboxyl carrier protein [Actinoalloteichus hoggarensis]|uniref:Biotin carboxyl carrier protein of acetyl-CoA carboxylase n=1 Tax=Actinoalloteichus hoggarensis TaxID=1470176 RepID=A0A221W295_9PSEU|nr:biotin/lipoyl-containing protein [Actinoalloteichus hoggarensis]ASO19721.1 Biotin carboxyl carrier protein of acetyl-CoA carboxylase [Actinoalloteichus hoggarensis]MBB5919572.1 acetyl-CoA carboxylase biotin carboxyl carrier protein [Actinoalloteichus hoggarensis]
MTGVEVHPPRNGQSLGDESPMDRAVAALGAQDALELLCRSVSDVVRTTPQHPMRVNVRFGCASVEVEWPGAGSAPAEGGTAPAASAPVAPTQAVEPDGVERPAVCAPLVGTFYRAEEPGARPFVEVGDVVEPGQQVGIMEAMKLMNPILTEHRGRVVEVVVADGQPVEYGQALVLLEHLEEE